jgi:hypothetical protein
LASRLDSLVCPLCEASKLHPSDRDSMHCQSCGTRLCGGVLEALRCIAALPDTLGAHACECGHPEMRLLPDDTFHCPSCGSEVLPVDVHSSSSRSEEGLAYWSGWADNPTLARWEDPFDRLDYYRGHRAGSEARQTRNYLIPYAN